MSLFGTDGVRGVANAELSPELALRLGRAAGEWLRHKGGKSAVIGRDTRQSGSMLGAALASGLNSSGISVTTMGVAPTPAVSHAVRSSERFDIGVVISASHNPAADNGIKFLSHSGCKLSDDEEAEIEALLDQPSPIGGDRVGHIAADADLLTAYENWLASLLPERLSGFTIALDCANGAAYAVAPKLLRRLGAEIVSAGIEPDGTNINDSCGATNPSTIQQLAKEAGASLGIAFDGDADRCVFSDEGGQLINGDKTMGIWAAFWEAPVVVGTVMSNAGFERALESRGIRLERTRVGDRYVSERLRDTGAKVGGEQSGHIIFPEWSPTGDGLLTAIQMLRVMQKSGCAASELPPVFDNWPQLLVNVRVQDSKQWKEAAEIHTAIADAEERLGGRGRIVVRPSGTQPMIRVMVEAQSTEERDAAADEIVGLIERDLGGKIQGRVDLTHALGD